MSTCGWAGSDSYYDDIYGEGCPSRSIGNGVIIIDVKATMTIYSEIE